MRNKCEVLVKEFLIKQGHSVRKMGLLKPDFLVDDEYYVEVKNGNYYRGDSLSLKQEYEFAKIRDKPIYVFIVKNNQIYFGTSNKLDDKKRMSNKTINVTFEDEEIEQLEARKGEMNWHDFIMLLIKKQKS